MAFPKITRSTWSGVIPASEMASVDDLVGHVLDGEVPPVAWGWWRCRRCTRCGPCGLCLCRSVLDGDAGGGQCPHQACELVDGSVVGDVDGHVFGADGPVLGHRAATSSAVPATRWRSKALGGIP